MVEQSVCTKQLRAAAPQRAQYKMKLGSQPAEGRHERTRVVGLHRAEAAARQCLRLRNSKLSKRETKKIARIIWMQTKSGIYLRLEICNYRSEKIIIALFVLIHKDSKLNLMTDEQLGKRNNSARFPTCRIHQNRFRSTSELG